MDNFSKPALLLTCCLNPLALLTALKCSCPALATGSTFDTQWGFPLPRATIVYVVALCLPEWVYITKNTVCNILTSRSPGTSPGFPGMDRRHSYWSILILANHTHPGNCDGATTIANKSMGFCLSETKSAFVFFYPTIFSQSHRWELSM